MIKTNLLTTIVLDEEIEVNIKTSDNGQVIVEMPVPKCPFNIAELREALDLCEKFIIDRKNNSISKPSLPVARESHSDEKIPPMDKIAYIDFESAYD